MDEINTAILEFLKNRLRVSVYVDDRNQVKVQLMVIIDEAKYPIVIDEDFDYVNMEGENYG